MAGQNRKTWLQFGHACLRVETRCGKACPGCGSDGFNSATPACAWRPLSGPNCSGKNERASIRPRLLARGDENPSLLSKDLTAMLQFGHACLRVETYGVMTLRGLDGSRFNSATPACAWRLPADTLAIRAGGASIRPRLLARGDTIRAARCRGYRRCFNSATPACAWRHLFASRCAKIRFASIRPRLLARGDGHAAWRLGQDAQRFNSATPACAWRLR